MSELYTHEELRDLTGKARSRGQGDWLKENGIPHRLDGRRVIVSRLHVQAWLEGRNIVVSSGLKLSAIK